MMKTIIAMLLLLAAPASSQIFGNGCDNPKELLDPTPVTNSQFGGSVDVHRNRAVVGSPVDNEAYVYERSGANWNYKATLSTGFNFGDAVAVYDTTIVVGTLLQMKIYTGSGTTWTLQQSITPAGSLNHNNTFGESVDIYKDTIIVGAPLGDTQHGVNAGAAFIYQRAGTVWSLTVSLHNAPAMGSWSNSQRLFGKSVSIAEDWVMVGNPAINTGFTVGSAVHIFGVADNYSGFMTFDDTPGNPSFEEWLGFRVDIKGNRAIAGAILANDGGNNAGKARTYITPDGTLFGWQEEATLVPSDVAADDQAGLDVAIKGNTVWIGGRLHDAFGIDAGAVWVYKYEGGVWVEKIKLGPTLGLGAGDAFGAHIGMNGGRYGGIAAPLTGSMTEGKVFIYNANTCPVGF